MAKITRNILAVIVPQSDSHENLFAIHPKQEQPIEQQNHDSEKKRLAGVAEQFDEIRAKVK